MLICYIHLRFLSESVKTTLMIIIVLVCLFSHFSLMAAENEHAGYVSAMRRQSLVGRHQHDTHFFAKYTKEEMTLEIKFIRQDGEVCGAYWDVFRLPHNALLIWRFVSEGIQNLIFKENAYVNEWDLKRYVLGTMAECLLQSDISVRHIYGIRPLEKEDMEEIMRAHMIKPWVLALTEEALSGGAPGTLRITALGAECCLLREPTVRPLLCAAVQGQNEVLSVLQEWSKKAQSSLQKLECAVQGLEHRMTELELQGGLER